MSTTTIVISAIAGGFCGAIGANWWGVNFAKNLDQVNPTKNPEWRFIVGRVQAKSIGIGILLATVAAIWKPHLIWKIEPQTFEFFSLYFLPPLLITWALGSRQLLRYLRHGDLPADFKDFSERNFPKSRRDDDDKSA